MAKSRAVAIRTRTRTVVRRARRKIGQRKIPLAVMAGLWPGASFAIQNPEHSFRQGMERVIWTYAGLVTWESKPRFDGSGLKYGLIPLAGGVLAHWLANVTGLNRAISRIPYVQI